MVNARRFPSPAPFVVAAVDDNHDGRLSMARRLVALAAGAGAHAVKFTLASGAEGFPVAAWRALRREATTKRVNLILAPHDRPSLRVARMAKPDAYQIDPAVLGDLDLVARVAAERRPVLVVAGGCTLAAIGAALEAVGRRPVVLLHTVTAQALPPSNARLRYLLAFAERFKVPVGYFGQEPGIGWAFVAATLGAVVVEKRITVDRTLPGASHTASIDAAELGAMVTGLADLAGALAPVGERRVFRDELASLEATSQSLVARRAMRQGHRLRASDIGSAVAAGGISPRLSPWAIGRRLRYDVEAGDPLTFGIVDTR